MRNNRERKRIQIRSEQNKTNKTDECFCCCCPVVVVVPNVKEACVSSHINDWFAFHHCISMTESRDSTSSWEIPSLPFASARFLRRKGKFNFVVRFSKYIFRCCFKFNAAVGYTICTREEEEEGTNEKSFNLYCSCSWWNCILRAHNTIQDKTLPLFGDPISRDVRQSLELHK